MTALHVYLLLLVVVATTVFVDSYDLEDTVRRIDRGSVGRYGAADSEGQRTKRSFHRGWRSPMLRYVRSIEQDLPEVRQKEQPNLSNLPPVRVPFPSSNEPKRETLREIKKSEKVISRSQQKKPPSFSYLPPAMVLLQHSNKPELETEQESEQESSRQSEVRGKTTEDFKKSALCVDQSISGPCPKKDYLHQAAEVLSAFDTLEHEEESGHSSVLDNNEFGEEGGDESEDLVLKNDFNELEFHTHLAHVTPTENIFLAWPVVRLCEERIKYAYYFRNQGFYLNSWDLPENVIIDPVTGDKSSKTFTWAEARSQCRKRCMDTISIEHQSELVFQSRVLAANRIPSIWTSGRICDFVECENKPELQPLSVNGWLWTGSGKPLPPTNAIPPKWSFQPWSSTGINVPQPDNQEFAMTGRNESCLAVLNNVGGDRISFHDIACHHKTHFTCEDSPELIELVFKEHGVKLSRPNTSRH